MKKKKIDLDLEIRRLNQRIIKGGNFPKECLGGNSGCLPGCEGGRDYEDKCHGKRVFDTEYY